METNLSNREDSLKIILVGCAKNEAAYLPEWIFYHLSLGFSSVHVYVNNTDDASVKILEKIAAIYPVSYTIADSLIKSPPKDYSDKTNSEFYSNNRVQSICYIDAYMKFTDQFDNIAFLDIDEFFYPLNSLNNLFSKGSKNTGKIRRFNWFNLSGDEANFVNLNETGLGSYDVFFKSIVPTGLANLKIENEHTASINGNIGEIDTSAIILHRVLRSKEEYLVLLARSTPQKKDLLVNGFKQNRRGWTNRGSDTYPHNGKIFEDYNNRLEKFTTVCNIKTEYELSKVNLLKKYESIKVNIDSINQQNTELVRSLNGLSLTHISLTKLILHTLLWRLIRLISPNLILSHVGIREYYLSKIKPNKSGRR